MNEVKVVYRTDYGCTGYWIKDALGIIAFFLTHDRTLAQQKCDSIYGKGKYIVSSRGGK